MIEHHRIWLSDKYSHKDGRWKRSDADTGLVMRRGVEAQIQGQGQMDQPSGRGEDK
jgi:hypothetical protein